MPIKKYMLNVDGKDHQVSEKNIEKYGIESYAKNYPGATIRMRDDKDSDYDIPINDYQRAVDSGLKPFVTSYYKDEEEEITERSTFKPDSVVYMNQTSQPEKLDITQGKGSQSVPETTKTGTDSTTNVPEMNEMGTQVAVKGADTTQTQRVKDPNVPVVDNSMLDAWEQRVNGERFVPAPKTESVSKKDDTLGKVSPKASDMTDTEWKKPTTYQDYMNELVSEWGGTPNAYPETRSEQMQREASANASAADKIWNGELKNVVDGLIEQGREEGRAKIREYQKTVYGNGGVFAGAAGMGDQSHKEYAKATDAKKVIEGVQQYLAEKNGTQTGGEGGSTNPLQEQLMQKVYDYLVQKNTPKSTAEYIMRNVFSGSILGQVMSMGDGKSYEQRQIETGGLQQYQPSAGEEIGAMAASVATDLPVMAVTGAVGGVAGNALLNGATKRLMASGLSEAAARAIATRAAQQTGMKWALRTASEAVNFGTLEGLGSMVGQAYQTGDVDLGKAATAMAKGAATGAVMGVFGVSNDKFRGMMEGGLGETAGRALGYTTSLGGRTAILTGSSVFGQYLEDPNFDINNVDWTKEIAHAGLMNLGFDILGAVKRYQAYRKTGIRMRDIEKLNLSKEDIAQLNEAGINGKDAQEIAESILQVKDAKELKRDAPEGKGLVPSDFGFASQELGVSKEGSVLGQLLSNENIDLATKAKVAYLMTGMQFRLAPNTNVSDVQEQADGSFTVEKFNPSGQTNETRRFKNRQEAEKYRHDMQNEVMPNQVNVLEGMMDNAGKMNTATRIFDMVAKMYNTGKEQIAEAYAKGKRGEELTGREAQAFKTIDDLLNSIQSAEDYQYSTRQLKNRMDEAYGQKTGWMDNVLKKKYNSLNETERRAYDEYISNMKSILQGNQRERVQIGGEGEPMDPEAGITPLLENQTEEAAMQMEPGNIPALPGGTSSAPATPVYTESAPSTARTAARETGAALYAEHDPAKMRQAVVRQMVARERLRNTGILDEAIDAIGEADDANREALLSGLDNNQRRLAEDYLQQTDVVDGMNEALTTAHLPEAEAAETLAQNMVSPHGKVVVVALGKNEDATHKYGVVVSGIDATGNLVSPEGQIIVVPLEATETASVDFSTFDDSKAISMRMEDAWGDVSQLEAEYVMDSMLSAAQEDENILEGQTPIVPGQTVLLADTEGNTVGAQVIGGSSESGWMVMEEGTNEPTAITEDELREMMLNAERIPVMQEYDAADKAYEREQREIQRQEERAAQKAREAEEAARIAEEMKKPINRLAKYPEGHKNAGRPDYENSQPEDVRAYLVESLGLEGAVKSIRNMRTSLEGQVAEQTAKIETIRAEMEGSEFLPDEAIAARELIAGEEVKLMEAQRKLDFWKGVERITAGPNQEEAQAAVKRSEAQQKAAKTKREVYKPSDEYRKMQKELSDSETALSVLNDLEPHTPEELAAQLISGGVRLMKADEQVGDTTLKGVMSMTGYGQADLQRLNFVFATRANGGVSVSEFGEMLEQAAKDAGIRFDGKTQEEGANALLSLLGEVETMGDINRYVERNRMREAQKLYDEEQNHFEDMREMVAMEEYGMSYADYIKLQDAITGIVEIRAGFTQDFWESETYKDFISNFAANIADNGKEGNDNAGSAVGIAEAGNNVADGNGRLVEGNQEPTGSVQAPVAMAADGEQGAQVPQGAAEDRAADGNGNDVPVSSGQGTGSDEGRTGVSSEQIEQAKQLANEAIEEVKKEIQGRPITVVGSLDDLSLYKERVGEEIFSKIEGGYNEPGSLASYVYEVDEIFVWANKAAEYGAGKQAMKAAVYHENIHSLIRGDRYTEEEFKSFANQIREAFPDIDDYVERAYASFPQSIKNEEVVTRYVEDLVDSRLEGLMLAGEGRIEGDTDAIGEELNHVINLLKDRKYERQGRNGRGQTLSVADRSENGQTAHRLQEDVSSEKQESVHSMEEQGTVGTSEGVGMAGRKELYGSVPGNGSAGEGSEGQKLVPATGREGKEGKADTYVVEKRHHAKLDQDVWAVKFTERFDRDKFLELKKEVKKFRGYYSSYGKGGFIFEDEAHARKFAESVLGVEAPAASAIEQARAEVNTDPTEAQKEAGNYKMGHLKLDGYDITIENPKGSVRSGKDVNGKEWRTTMNNDYGYIRGTKAVDGDHIDVFLSDKPEEGRVFVVDQTKQDGSFDESKVMYGFNSLEEAREAYLSNYDAGWESRIMAITEVSKEEFKKWIDSSTRKTKAFSEYKSVKPSIPVAMPKEGDFLKNNIAGGDAVAVVRGVGEQGYLVAYAPGMEEAEAGFFMGEKLITRAEMEKTMQEGGYTPINKQETELKPTYDEQGRETIESQAGHSRSEAERLASEAESGSLEAAPAAGRGSGTSGNRPAESAGGSRKPESVNGYRIGEKVLYKGKEATIYDFENDGTPVLDTGMAPVIYEVGYWDNIEKLPTTVEQINRIAEAAKPAKKLERAERAQKKNQAKREKQKEQMVDLFSQVDAMEEKLVRQEQEIDAQLALLSEYKAGPKAQVREDMHTGAAKTLEKAGRKFAKALASRLGGHVDGKDISNGLTNIAPIGGDMVFRVWLDDADTQGVMMLINFDAAPDTQDFDKLVPKYGFWRMISDKDRSGVRNSNHNFYIENMSELESGSLMSRIADDMLSALNREAVKTSNVTTYERPKTTEVLTNKKEDDGRNQGTDPGMGTEARQEAERTEPGRDDRGVHGNNVPDTQGSGRVSERDGEQQPSVSEPSPVATSVKRNTHNWNYGETHLELPTGEIGKLKGNIEAIRTLKELEASGQPATPEQKQALLKFVGWGGLAEALNSAEYADWQRKVKEAQRWGWSETGAATAWSKKWGKHYEDLRPLMTDEEWAAAQASTLNSHYTPETVIRGLWEALEYMGFKGGSIQEPAMGVGHILGFMPKAISERSMLSGFELDSIPGRIAKQLYPDADITVAGYETQFRPGSKDAIVTNVPFGQTAPVDPALDKALRKKLGSSYNLHNYFIIKGLLELRPGGVGVFITSAATMDGRNTKAREYISSLGVDLVGAIRLPNNTFKSNAGTEVTADMLFFRKRLPGEAGNGIAFTSLTQVGTGKNKVQDKKGNDMLVDVPLLVNEYFAERPEMMLGEVMTAHDAGSGGLYGGDNLTLVARPGTELAAELADAIGRLPENIFKKGTVSGKPTVPGEATTQKDGTLSVKDGKVYVASKGELSEIASGTFKHNGKARSYVDATKDYQELKETLKALIQAEQSQAEDPVELRKQLNAQYDQFVEKYGRLNENKNLNVVMEEDPERFLPQALEKVETVTNPTTGRRTKVVSKGDGILAKRVSQPMTEPTTAENLGDAIGISQAYRGRMDVGYIADMLGITTDEARERILAEREAYEDPVTGDLVDRDAYLSGNIREKLETARAAAENDSRYEQNVTDLEKAMPESIPFVDIFYKMGTPWIPEDVYEDFGREVCGIENMQISYAPVIDQFVINKGYISDFTKAGNFATTSRNAMQLFEDAINLRKPVIMKTVTDSHGNEVKVRDEQATQEAIQAVMDMNDAFIQYIQEAKPLHARLTSIYNDRYNNYRLREYREPAFKGADGKVHYPNANPALTLRKHQVKAVQRSLQGSTLLAHQVGTGKTFTMITTAMEMRRLGLAKKPMIVVQNATLQDFASDFMKLYPSAKILVPNETERSASQRKRLFNLIATGDFDAIIVPQSFLAFIPDDEGRKKALIMARVDEIMAAADALQYTDKQLANKLKREAEALELSLSGEEKASKKGGKRVKDQAKKQESALVRETQKLDRRTDDVLTFEQMGVDALFIDEAHNYKKIGFTTKMQNVKGVDTGYSERANSLYLKVSYVQEKNGGRNVILATGTPITNTMAEVWTMMRFVAPEILQDYGIRTFDEFAATFGQVEPSLEQNSTGGFKIADRFKSYVNVPELVKAFRSHADVVLTTDVEEFKESKNIPKLKDGRMTNHVIQKSDKLQDVMDVLIAALKEDEKKSGKEKTPGLPLVVFSKAKQAAIDLRLINPEYADDPDSKTNRVVGEVMRIYKESTPDKGIQMIFCDSYQSPASAPAIDLFDYDPSVPQFNLYRDIKNKLIEAGIPKEEIVIVSEITNADRKKAVFEKARAGAVRVLIGSTEKMGVGVNVQERMIALHHMDAPIRPMDFEQRNGRILRQGNMFAAMDKPVEVLTYGVEGTLDATAYERLRIKQDFINQMMKGDVSGRVMEESDDEDPSGKTFSQMAAELSGDKTLQLLFIAENKVKKLEGLRRSHEMKREQARVEAAMLKTDIVRLKNKLKDAEKVGEQVAKRFPEGVTKLTINGRPVTEKLSKVLAETLEDYEGRYALNRSVVFPVIELNDKAAKMVFGHTLGQLQYSLFMDKFQLVDEKPINTYAGVWLSLNSALANSGKRAEEIRQAIATSEARIKGAESIQEKEFDKMDELKERRQEVKELKAELAKKAENAPTPTGDVKLAKKNLKSGEKPVSLPEEMAGDSEESLDRMETAMKPFEEVAVNAPEMVIAQSGSDILAAMPRVEPLQFAKVVTEANRPEVQAMYVPWTKQIIMLPKHGTVKEMRDKRWHESFHFALDMVLPQGDAGRLMLERAAGEVNKLAPSLSKWVEETYGNRNTSEEKLVHMLEEVLSYMEDAGKVKSIRGGLDFGSQYPVLNEISNKVINYLTNNGHGKETDNYSGYDEGSEPTYRGEDQEGRNEEDFTGVRGSASSKEERIEKLRKSQPIVAEWKDYEGRYELNKESAEKYILNSLRGNYTNKDTGEEIKISRKSVKVMHHDVEDEVHLKSVALIPEMLEESIFIEEIKNEKGSGKFDSYRYYVVGLKLDGVDYTAKLVVGVKGGDAYYDHALTEIEKSDILNQIDLVNAQVYDENTALSDIKDKRLISILQTNSKENTEIKLGLRGKPRRKAGESLISYNRRLKEWQQEVEEAKKRRDVENMDVENPLDTELNDLVMESMKHPTPIRKPGESDADFNARHAEWSEWYNNRRPEIQRRMAEIKVQLENEKAAARSKEMKRTEEPLYTGEVPPQKDDEGQLSDEEMREVREIFQKKLADMKISVDKDQIKRDIKQEIIERRRYIETSNLEDTFFVDKVKKVAGSKEVLKAIPDYIEGTYTGEVTTDLVEASKLVSDWFEEVYNLMAMEGVLYDAPQIQNYVTHIWDWKRTPKEAQERYANWVNTMRLRSPFTKHRVIPSYKEGIAMGMVPKYDDITGILLEYGHYATETIANKRMIEFLRNFKVMVPGGKDNLPMEMDIIVPDKVKDPMYSRMNHTALDGYKVLTQIKPMITPVFGDQRIIDPSHLTPLANKLIDGIWATSGLMKKIALSFSFFHHGALTETAIAMLGPARAGKVIAKNLTWDVITKGNIPALNDKEAARDAVKHLVSLGASNDYVTADVNNLTTSLHRFLKDKNVHVAKEAAYILDFLNKGSDKFLWDTIHDGFKIASFAKMAKEIRAKAEREGWSQEELEKSLDEAGHLVNDTFGGLHFDVLGFSPKSVRMMRALLLSPDWTLATIRQALSPLGFGKLYGNEGFWKTILAGEKPAQMRKKYGRAFWVTAGIFFYALMNGLNAYFRAADEDEEKKKADEMRKVDPSYKSPYELAYPNGMKWYDYTMLGNTLGHQTHLFTGRYEDGTETYARWGKQFRELPELFFGRDGFSFPGPMIDKMSGKANPVLSTTFEFISGHSLSGWENAQMKDKKGWERDVARLHMLAMKFVPYSMPTQEDKEWYWLDLIMPSSKGFSSGKAIGYFEKGIKGGDMDYIAAVYNACVMNGVNPEQSFKVAKARIEAETKRETLEGVETVQDAMRMFDEATDVKERKRLLRYIEQQTGAQDYQAISQEEMVQQAKDVINGNDVKVEASDYYLEHATGEDVMQDYRMKKTQAGLKKYHQDYTELMMENPAAGQRMLKEKHKYIEGYVMTSKYRNAINKVKKAMKDGRIEANKGMEEIRKIRREYFENLDKLEVK